MNIIPEDITQYMEQLAAVDDEPVLLEMEALAKEKEFPIIGRLCGQVLELFARSIGASRIFEMGSGYGYSAYWFARATGDFGEIHLTDTDEGNRDLALDFLERAGHIAPINFHVSDAFSALDEAEGLFDVVYCDIDKGSYPEAWERGKQRVRVGGFYICDNMLWSGRVVAPEDTWTEAIVATNKAISSDPDWRSTIIPTRDGVIAALRIR
jgi:caffeoyl-CoA O-methyltransferase